MCSYYSRKTHPTLEKPGAQNVAAFENPGEQSELHDFWKLIKTMFLTKK